MAIWTTKIEIIASWIEFNSSVSERFHSGTSRTFNRSLGGGRIYLAEKHGARFRNIYFLLAASESLPGRPRCGELVALRVCVFLHVFLANSEFTVTLWTSQDCRTERKFKDKSNYCWKDNHFRSIDIYSSTEYKRISSNSVYLSNTIFVIIDVTFI